jgi:hypothetical protein
MFGIGPTAAGGAAPVRGKSLLEELITPIRADCRRPGKSSGEGKRLEEDPNPASFTLSGLYSFAFFLLSISP